MKYLPCFTALVLAAGLSTAVHAANWPQWRGPAFNGSTTEKGLPSTWSKTEGVRWVTPLPGPSGATPVVWEDTIFVSSPDKEKNLNLLCLNRKDGSIRWQKTVAIGDRTVGRNNMAAPSPVTDGKAVYAMFGTSDLVAFDFKGNQLWARNIGKDFGKLAVMWLYGSSPLLFEGRLYVQVLQRETAADYAHAQDGSTARESYLLGIDPRTGQDLFRVVRPTDAIKESHEAYSTPMPFKGPNGLEIIVMGGDYVTGHNPKTGVELWRTAGLNAKKDPWWRVVPTPVTGDGLVFAFGPKRDPVFAIKGGGKGDITASHTAWTSKEFTTDWSTPTLYQGSLYVLDGDKKLLSVVNPATGEKKWQGSIGIKDTVWSSPTAADGKLYIISEGGNVVVVETGAEPKVLSPIAMGEGPVKSSIVAAKGQLFIRTAENLYCIGSK